MLKKSISLPTLLPRPTTNQKKALHFSLQPPQCPLQREYSRHGAEFLLFDKAYFCSDAFGSKCFLFPDKSIWSLKMTDFATKG